MRHVVVAEDPLGAARVANAGDHRGVVLLVRIDHAAGQQAADGGQRRLVGDEARGEQQRRWLVVQRRQLALQEHVQVRRARDVARAAGTRAHRAHRLDAGVQDHRMLAHAEVVVRTPHGDRMRLGVGIHVALRMRERARLAREIAEHPVAAFAPDPIDRMPKDMFVVHQHLPASDAASPNERRSHAHARWQPHMPPNAGPAKIFRTAGRPAAGRSSSRGRPAQVCPRHHPGALSQVKPLPWRRAGAVVSSSQPAHYPDGSPECGSAGRGRRRIPRSSAPIRGACTRAGPRSAACSPPAPASMPPRSR